MKTRKIEIVEYNPEWPRFFAKESANIQNIFKQDLISIHHFGSTAIPNMPAKPVIDILMVFENLDDKNKIEQKLIQLNYEPLRRSIIPHFSYFTFREEDNVRFHLHIYAANDPQINRHLAFFQYLIAHPDEQIHYALIKKKLARQFEFDSFNYVKGKDEFVQSIDRKAKKWYAKNKEPQKRQLYRTNWTQEKIIKSMEANLNVQLTHFAQYLSKVELIREPGITIVNSNLTDETFNLVLDAHFDEQNAPYKIQKVTQYFQQKNLPFSWWISPSDLPKRLDNYLQNSGYQHAENNIGMYFDLDIWQDKVTYPPKLTIVRALDKKTLHDFACVLTNDKKSFEKYFEAIAEIITEDDPIEYYVGYVDQKPVVRGLLCYYANVAGLSWLSTNASERNKGYATAMQQFRLQRAKSLGYSIAVLQAAKEGFPLYQKLGYKECGLFREFKLM